MSAEIPARRVQLVIAGGSLHPAEMEKILGIKADHTTWKGSIPDRAFSSIRRPAREHSWEIGETGDGATDVSSLIEKLFVRIRSMATGIRELKDHGCIVMVSVVVYVNSLDETGPGFSLLHEDLNLLSKIGAGFEMDHYIIEGD